MKYNIYHIHASSPAAQYRPTSDGYTFISAVRSLCPVILGFYCAPFYTVTACLFSIFTPRLSPLYFCTQQRHSNAGPGMYRGFRLPDIFRRLLQHPHRRQQPKGRCRSCRGEQMGYLGREREAEAGSHIIAWRIIRSSVGGFLYKSKRQRLTESWQVQLFVN